MINCSNVSKSFNEHRVLDNISFNIPEGTIVGLLGPSGAGKTTLIKILTGQLDFDSGKVNVMNKDVRNLKGTDKNRFGIMMDQFGIYDRFTCVENLSVFADVYGIPKSKVRESLRSVGLEQASNTKALNLSKGMRARLLLARAMMHDPKILFLDEPTSGLDPKTMRGIHDMILEKKDGRTIFITTHNMEEASKLCDDVMLLNDGCIVEQGKPADLCRKYYRSKKLKIRLDDGSEKEFTQDSESAEVVSELMKEGRVETIHSEEPTLETVFLELTGKKLTED